MLGKRHKMGPAKGREEGKRLRCLIRKVVQGQLLDPFGEGQAQVQPLEEAPVRYWVESEAITMDDNGFHAPDEAAEDRPQEAENICGQCSEHYIDTEGCWYHPGWLYRNEAGQRKWACCERVECVQFCERWDHTAGGFIGTSSGRNSCSSSEMRWVEIFLLPFHLCYTWLGMEALIKKSFLYTVVDPKVQEGHYDLLGPDGEIIPPSAWEATVKDGWPVTMRMWPEETNVARGNECGPRKHWTRT
ncbi:hypothetical protein B0T26DRAFT_96128 [Lasiosphaeria miniovina]|uniref:Ubiquitin-like domain-containing protein n=1 Tax=Lasiosphaeria miniovina TaxID=1954250 RepID=A0AA40BJ17_9PEZI|nr:uncharacterized protein B0T26DRAFT_96128 [Lasiosphaeria miniovina]KAK0735121.1 hypothetical protein B0T26DRAFT_96128 [Lasiosphaeria miniovina]